MAAAIAMHASKAAVHAAVRRQPGLMAARPSFHMAPVSGWINDPNAPLLYNGQYHMFYQHVPDSSEWQWGLVWGHAVSTDLVRWRHLPVALAPTPGTLDRDGCFSGCSVVDDATGLPTILYTGVVRKPQDAQEKDVSPQWEYQLAAVATPGDEDLVSWNKVHVPLIAKAPEGLDVTGWRDPFVLERPCAANDDHWVIMVGSGLRGEAGTAMVYRSKSLTSSAWEYMGMLCKDTRCTIWECPVMAQLGPHPSAAASPSAAAQQLHFLCACQDYCANVPDYWLGHYSQGRFDMDTAQGPFPVDLGDILYAPQLTTDAQGRTILWAWLQEQQRPQAPHDYACCLTVPRHISLRDGRLWQEPIPELSALRRSGDTSGSDGLDAAPAWSIANAPIAGGGAAVGVEGPMGPYVDLELSFQRGSSAAVAVLLKPLAEGGSGAAIVVGWGAKSLHVVHSLDLDELALASVAPVTALAHEPHHPEDMPASVQRLPEPAARRVGGALMGAPLEGYAASSGNGSSGEGGLERLSLRLLVDGSCVEVFTSTGEALATRVYRGNEDACIGNIGGSAANIEVIALGGEALLASGAAWEVAPMWQTSELLTEQGHPVTALLGLEGMQGADMAFELPVAPVELEVAA